MCVCICACIHNPSGAGANQLSELYVLQWIENAKRNAMMYAELCRLHVWVCGCVVWWVRAGACWRKLMGGVCEYVSMCVPLLVCLYMCMYSFIRGGC